MHLKHVQNGEAPYPNMHLKTGTYEKTPTKFGLFCDTCLLRAYGRLIVSLT